jgi:hypothetical protein
MLTPTGIITPVWINELIPRECLCMLYAQWVNLFWNEGGVVQLPAPYITLPEFFVDHLQKLGGVLIVRGKLIISVEWGKANIEKYKNEAVLSGAKLSWASLLFDLAKVRLKLSQR